MNKLLAVIFLSCMSSSYALTMHKAVMLSHKTTVTGKDDKGYAIEGHMDGQKKTYAVHPKK